MFRIAMMVVLALMALPVSSKETLMSTTPPGGEGFTLEPGKAHRLAIFPCGLRFPGPA